MLLFKKQSRNAAFSTDKFRTSIMPCRGWDMNIEGTIARWKSFLLQGEQVIPEKYMVLGMSLRFRPPLKHPPAAQFDIQIRDSRIQMITRSNSFPSITSLGRRFFQQTECKLRHTAICTMNFTFPRSFWDTGMFVLTGQCMGKGGNFLKQLWCCVGGSV